MFLKLKKKWYSYRQNDYKNKFELYLAKMQTDNLGMHLITTTLCTAIAFSNMLGAIKL